MTKKQSERQEAIERLRETLKPGDTVYTVLRSVSRSGMSRDIDLYVIEDNQPRWISRLAARAMDVTFNEKKDCIKVGGCGMDMGYHLVYTLSHALFQDRFECLGDGHNCPSNDHSNAYYHDRNNECMICRTQVNGSKLKRKHGHHEYKVCSEECRTKIWQHSDGGYALHHKWM